MPGPLLLRRIGILAVAASGIAFQAFAATPPTNAWEVVTNAITQIQPLVDAGRYREASSAWRQVLGRTRDKEVKEYARYACTIYQYRHDVARGRPGKDIISMTFDDGIVPPEFLYGREGLVAESGLTLAPSAGALRILGPNAKRLIVAEACDAFLLESGTILTACVYGHNLGETKFQLLTSHGNVHFYWKKKMQPDAWNILTFRLDRDGTSRLDLGDRIESVAIVGDAVGPGAFMILDELHVIAHP